MLKLEKTKSKEIKFSYKRHEGLFSKAFFIALSGAVFLHLLAFLIFSIHTYFSNDEAIYNRVTVELDLGNTEENLVIANIENKNIEFNLNAPTYSHPTFSIIKSPTNKEIFKEPALKSLESHLFREIEPYSSGIVFHKKKNCEDQLKIILSGPIGSIPLVNSEIEKINNDICKTINSRISFNVKVEGKTGQIFWQEKIDSSENPNVNEIAEDILNHLKFAHSPLSILDGKIEIILSSGLSYD